MKRNRIVLLLGVGILFLISFIIVISRHKITTGYFLDKQSPLQHKPIENQSDIPDTIFTCTTFLDFQKGDRWERFCDAIDSIHRYHDETTLARIHKWVVINEYAETPIENWREKVKVRYPFIDFIQKGASQKGQATSMNMILERIRPYRLWIHWEEAWEARAPFLEDAFEAMDTSDITQIQFTFEKGKVDWMDTPKKKQKCEGRICRILAADSIGESLDLDPKRDWNWDILSKWPLYSLRPSINRVEDYTSLGTFSNDPDLWPIKFEWDYGRRWYHAGCIKAVFKDGPAWRPGNHTSTYQQILK